MHPHFAITRLLSHSEDLFIAHPAEQELKLAFRTGQADADNFFGILLPDP